MTVKDAQARVSFNIVFNSETEKAIRLLWKQIAALDVEVPGVTGYRPHITLAVYDVVDYAPLESDIESAIASASSFAVRLDSLGVFIDTGVVFLAPKMSQAMLSLHQKVITCFRAAGRPEVVAEFLLPDFWAPHVTLATFSASDALSAAIEACRSVWNPIHAIAEAVTMRVHPSTDDYRYFALESPKD